MNFARTVLSAHAMAHQLFATAKPQAQWGPLRPFCQPPLKPAFSVAPPPPPTSASLGAGRWHGRQRQEGCTCHQQQLFLRLHQVARHGDLLRGLRRQWQCMMTSLTFARASFNRSDGTETTPSLSTSRKGPWPGYFLCAGNLLRASCLLGRSAAGMAVVHHSVAVGLGTLTFKQVVEVHVEDVA